MATLTILRGLPSSGKSTLAAQLVAADTKNRTKRVERDMLREMFDFSKWSHTNEKNIVKAMLSLIETLLNQNYNVISSDTNLNPSVVKMLTDVGIKANAMVIVNDTLLDVEPLECIQRNAKRANGVPESVIWKMYYEYVNPITPRKPQKDLRTCVITDLDGTLADISHRNPYDASTCLNDPMRHHVQQVLWHFEKFGIPIFIFSGRNEKYREQTEAWLEMHGITYKHLHMRAVDDNRKDSIIKREMFDNHIASKYNVAAVFDDRPQVIRVWRDLGLPVFDVGCGYEF